MILNSVAQKMKKEGRKVTFLSALDYRAGISEKETDDVLDIMFRQRYEDLGIVFQSMADLRTKNGGGRGMTTYILI